MSLWGVEAIGMDAGRNLLPSLGGPRGALRLITLVLALGAAACSSTSDAETTGASSTVAPRLSLDTVEIPADTVGPDLAFSDDPPEELVNDTTTRVVTTTTKPVDDSPVFGEDAEVSHVRVSTDGDPLNVRSAPDAGAPVVGSLASVTWYVEATGNVVDVGDVRWREVALASGETGWAHGDFLEVVTPECADVVVDELYESSSWSANLDGDGVNDVVTYLRGQDGAVHVRVEFGNGAVTAQQVAQVGTDFPERTQGSVVAQDLDGDGYDEIQFALYAERGSDTRFISMDGCSFVQHTKPFTVWTSAGTEKAWACKDFGTSNVQFFDIEWTADAGSDDIIVANGYTFDPVTGFTSTGEVLEMTRAASDSFFDQLCSSDYD